LSAATVRRRAERGSRASIATAASRSACPFASVSSLNYDLLFKWFLGMRIDERAFDASTFSKNRRRLLDHEIADRFFAAVGEQFFGPRDEAREWIVALRLPLARPWRWNGRHQGGSRVYDMLS
jgi:hypothetical protein